MLFLAFVIDAAFALAIMGFLIMHCRMIAKNLTTIEMYEKRRSSTGPWVFDKGAKQNFVEVFGKKYVSQPASVFAACLRLHDFMHNLDSMLAWRLRHAVTDVCLPCSRARWFVPAYTKEEVRELLSNTLHSRPSDFSDTAELTMPRSLSNTV